MIAGLAHRKKIKSRDIKQIGPIKNFFNHFFGKWLRILNFLFFTAILFAHTDYLRLILRLMILDSRSAMAGCSPNNQVTTKEAYEIDKKNR